jgi:hypothetical protein
LKEIEPPEETYDSIKPEDILTPGEVNCMVGACRNSRDRAFIMTLYETGARVGEVARLTWNRVMKTIDSFIMPLYDFILVLILDLKKIAVLSFAFAFADNILLTLISIFLQTIGEPGSTGILKQSFGIITYILGFWGVAAFCVFFLSAIGFAVQKFPRRDDDLVI